MEFVNYLTDKNVATFMLLFARMSGLIVFFPFFSHNAVPLTIKTCIALFLTIYLFPLARLDNVHLDSFLILQILAEILFGMVAGLMLDLVFYIIMMAGEEIAFNMGLTMANVVDPSTGSSVPLTSQLLHLLAILVFLAFDGHHLILLFMGYSLDYIELGVFFPGEDFLHYINNAMFKVFLIGFTMAFPITGIILLADVIFGLLMKTMPQFNLLVVGFPIKIGLAIAVVIVILFAMMQYFKELILETFSNMQVLFFT
ncbi:MULTISPECIES: flagellar biosynthetic protein FliR [unclassified Campylobacter]|uniref:flagellar biosynthetic protein FliR n=1 Tax=unclassified Campylobacter TaxID=2593542 RepID=UPI001237BE60|nr:MULTISPECIES: flagellar biosynthetic protein FliR [unclassified Campylobacter]KAA6226374.1 flagellar type III secretion system protein FliR [Campylobacter sp. LR286c]KAA6226588.1 flagellar type III secretion system protein FliR [Campylobacter sp. LR185c]KAA6226866.1 flagellar type III secretion system protein FliR [Campylobacter sp. LR196d]KAA6230303.1 flagellar type III secretion system protein FliR [Campylobacter sp. LR291e]KAA6233824.1 flagellar type III secretion system protein FliR [Ca